MKFTLSWLKDHLETDASLEDICETLTMIGLEVEAVDDRGSSIIERNDDVVTPVCNRGTIYSYHLHINY